MADRLHRVVRLTCLTYQMYNTRYSPRCIFLRVRGARPATSCCPRRPARCLHKLPAAFRKAVTAAEITRPIPIELEHQHLIRDETERARVVTRGGAALSPRPARADRRRGGVSERRRTHAVAAAGQRRCRNHQRSRVTRRRASARFRNREGAPWRVRRRGPRALPQHAQRPPPSCTPQKSHQRG